MIYNLVGWVINLFNEYIPKSKGIVSISTFPDYDDMCRGVLEVQGGRVIVLLQNKYAQKPFWVPVNVKGVKKNSIVGLYYLFRSSKIYYTHGIFGFFKVIDENKQLVINLWHGMPIKNIGYLDGKSIVSNFHYVLSSSPFFVSIISKAFGVRKDKVLIDTLPRNKILLRKSNNKKLSKIKSKYKKIHIWLPTYRKSSVGDIRNDGNSSSIFGFDGLNLELLNNALVDTESLLIVKPHPMALQVKSFYEKLSNIIIINENWLYEHELTLYELLSTVDTLWTDFSSVFIDFLLVNKPIIFVIPDFNQYKNNRGFTFPLNREMLPGPVIESKEELISYLKLNRFSGPSPSIVSKFLH